MDNHQRSLQYFFPAATPPTQMAQAVVPVPPDILKGNDWQALEGHVDQFIKDKAMREGEQFVIPYPEGPETYKYLGPNSGGRKDWIKVTPTQPDLTS